MKAGSGMWMNSAEVPFTVGAATGDVGWWLGICLVPRKSALLVEVSPIGEKLGLPSECGLPVGVSLTGGEQDLGTIGSVGVSPTGEKTFEELRTVM